MKHYAFRRRMEVVTLSLTVFTATTLAWNSSPAQLLHHKKVTQRYALNVPLLEVVVPLDDDDDTAKVAQVRTTGAISMPIEELAERLGGLGRARLVWDCYNIGIDPIQYFSDSSSSSDSATQARMPGPRRTQRLGQEALERLRLLNGHIDGDVATMTHVSTSSDRTTKMLLQLQEDGTQVETVIIPWMEEGRSTLCVSSQVGCLQGCQFCATGKMGKVRSLSSDEILAQMFFGRRQCHNDNLPPISNIVFMGMGEPADNAHAVVAATQVLTARRLFGLSAHKVCVSTVAPSPKAFETLGAAPCVLAWSVHAVDDALRRKLVPTTKSSMVELRQGLINALVKRPPRFRTTMLEVALIDGVNDDAVAADKLSEFSQGILDAVPGSKLVVNLIPCNDIGLEGYRKPSDSAVRAFQKRIQDTGVRVHIRTTRGDDENAACGQLVTLKKKKRQKETVPDPS